MPGIQLIKFSFFELLSANFTRSASVHFGVERARDPKGFSRVESGRVRGVWSESTRIDISRLKMQLILDWIWLESEKGESPKRQILIRWKMLRNIYEYKLKNVISLCHHLNLKIIDYGDGLGLEVMIRMKRINALIRDQ